MVVFGTNGTLGVNATLTTVVEITRVETRGSSVIPALLVPVFVCVSLASLYHLQLRKREEDRAAALVELARVRTPISAEATALAEIVACVDADAATKAPGDPEATPVRPGGRRARQPAARAVVYTSADLGLPV